MRLREQRKPNTHASSHAGSALDPALSTATPSVVASSAWSLRDDAPLLALKILARDDRTRPQDRTDIGLLLRKASRDEIADARRSLKRITERGFHRSRDLMRALDDASREFATRA